MWLEVAALICAATGCSKDARRAGLCGFHHKRKLAGIPLDAPRKRQAREVLDQTVESALLSQTDGCISWPFATDRGGYGTSIFADGEQLVHRHICRRAHGDPPPDKPWALHTCGNGHLGCINPRHLYWGTPADNVRDSVRDGAFPVGEARKNTKLTSEQVLEIKRRASAGEAHESIAVDFPVQRRQVSRIAAGDRWQHLD